MNYSGEKRSSLPATTIVEALRMRAERHGHSRLYTFIERSETEYSHSDIERMARMVAAHLQERKMAGERVIVFQSPGLQYTISVLGCLFAGAIAVPAFPPDPRHLAGTLPPLLDIIADCGATMMLTSSFMRDLLRAALESMPELASMAALPCIETDALDESAAAGWRDPNRRGDDIAFLQYTSGSTRSPRGVMITHDNLIQSARALAMSLRQEDDEIGVTWLPPYHGMGLIGTLLQPIYSNIPMVVMSPQMFLDQPLYWLELITRYKATCSLAPSFAYDLCVQRVTPEALERLDLRSWRIALCGAEPVLASTLHAFAETFAPAGFDTDAFVPCYGLSEATLLVSMRDRSRASAPTIRSLKKAGLEQGWMLDIAEGDVDPRKFVACGPVMTVLDARIVDPETCTEQFPNQIGEIWISGPLVAMGYWNAPEETERTFQARLATGEGPFLRTGDLGCILDGELYVLGHGQDRLIIAGRSLHPQDIEYTVERAHPALRPSAGVCFSIEHQSGERLVVVQEVVADSFDDPQEIIDAIQKELDTQHQMMAHDVVLIPAGTVCKTSNGKIRRSACRDAYLGGTLEIVARSRSASHGAST